VEEMTFPLLQMIHPEIRDGWAYYEAGFHDLFVVSVEERYTKEAMKTALGLLGIGQLSLTKCMVMVSDRVDVRNFKEVLQEIRENFDPTEDFLLLPGVPLDTLDFTSFKMNLGSKMILDATRKNAEGGMRNAEFRTPHSAPRTPKFKDPKEIDNRILEWRLLEDVLLVVKVKENGREILENLVGASPLSPGSKPAPTRGSVKIIAIVSPDVPLDNDILLLWGIFTRFDCARDICFTSSVFGFPPSPLGSAWPVHRGILGIDSTLKMGYPNTIDMSPEIVERVDQRWGEYGI